MSDDSCAWNNTLCEELGVVTMLLDHISQRDISYEAGIDQSYLPGVSVNSMGSEWENWMETCLSIGFKAFFLDFTWDSNKLEWTLCSPSSSRHNTTDCATLYNVSTVLSDYINQTDTNLGVDLLKVSLRFSISSDLTRIDRVAMNRTSLFDAIDPISSRILSPDQVRASQGTNSISFFGTNRWNPLTLWPSLEAVLLTAKDRVILNVDVEQLPFNATYDPLDGLAFNSLHTVSQLAPIKWPRQTMEKTTIDFDALADDPFRSLSIQSTSNGSTEEVVSAWVHAMNMGFSPVLNGSITTDILYQLGTYYQWSWAEEAPALETAEERQKLLSNQNFTMCAAQTTDGWQVGNCHDEGFILCLNQSDRFDWTFSEGYTPFTASEDQKSCPQGYAFASPNTHIQSVAVRHAMTRENISWAWTAVNSLSVENCWVDGVNTYCPYNIVQGDRNGVALLTVVSAIGLGLIIVMIFLEYQHLKVPLKPRATTKKRKKYA